MDLMPNGMNPETMNHGMDPAYSAALVDTMNQPPYQEGGPEPKPQSNDDIVDGEIMSMILKRRNASEVWKQAKKDKWDKCWNHYNQIYDTTNKEKWQSSTFIPASPKVAEVIAANLHAATMSPEKPAEYVSRLPRLEGDVNDANSLIAVDMDKSDFKLYWADFEKTLCILGTAIGKIEYIKEYANVMIKERVKPLIPGFDRIRQMLGFGPAQTEQMTQKRMLVRDYSSFRNVDPYDFFPQPGITDISKDTWVIERGKICNYKLIELSRDPEMPLVNVNDDVLMSNPKDLDKDGQKQEKDAANDNINKTQAYMDPDQEHELLEYWGSCPIWMVHPELYGDESRKYEMVYGWFWLIDGLYVVRRNENPWRDVEPPYISANYIRVPGYFWGIGPLELILGLQVELNELRNTRQDEINMKLNKPIAVIKSMVAQGEWGRLVAGPGALWVFDNVDDVRKALQTVDYDANTVDSMRASGEVYNEIQEVTAATKATIGTGGGSDQSGGDTFRGQLLNKQTSGERFLMYARILERTGLSRAYEKYYQRIYQYKDWESASLIVGEQRSDKFRFMSPEELGLVAKLVPLGVTTMENKGVKVAQMRDQFALFQGKPWFKEVDFARGMIVTGGDADPDRYIMSDEELRQFNQARREMMGMMGGGGGMPGEGQPPTGSGPEMGPSGPVAGGMPGPNDGQSQPSMPSRGPGASPIDFSGMPM